LRLAGGSGSISTSNSISISNGNGVGVGRIGIGIGEFRRTFYGQTRQQQTKVRWGGSLLTSASVMLIGFLVFVDNGDPGAQLDWAVRLTREEREELDQRNRQVTRSIKAGRQRNAQNDQEQPSDT